MTVQSATRIERREAQPYLGVRCDAANGIGEALSWAYRVLFTWLDEREIAPSGPPFVRVLGTDPQGRALELEAAVPVAVEVFAEGLVHSGMLDRG